MRWHTIEFEIEIWPVKLLGFAAHLFTLCFEVFGQRVHEGQSRAR